MASIESSSSSMEVDSGDEIGEKPEPPPKMTTTITERGRGGRTYSYEFDERVPTNIYQAIKPWANVENPDWPSTPIPDGKAPLLKREEREFFFSDEMLEEDERDSKLGIHLLPNQTDNKLGWLLTFATGLLKDPVSDKVYSCVDLYFVSEDGSRFKCKYKFNPYFYVTAEGQCSPCSLRSYLKVYFETVKQLIHSREDLINILRMKKNRDNKASTPDLVKCILGCAEADIPYHARFAIDNDIRCGQWYSVSTSNTSVFIDKWTHTSRPAEVCVCALHIEYAKPPGSTIGGPILMISYMVDGKGYLLVNREYVGEDIKDFYYTPRLGDEGRFKVASVQNEVKPCIYVTCNGDNEDWGSLQRRAAIHGIVVYDEIGIGSDAVWFRGYRSKFACHIDCSAWIRRDRSISSRIALAIRKKKYRYSEDNVYTDKGLSQWLACHSVSEAVATRIIYWSCVHPYIFSIAAILPLPPDDILRLETLTLCKLFCRTKAYKAGYVVHSPGVEHRYLHEYPLVDGDPSLDSKDSKWQTDTKRVDGESLKECLWYGKEKGCLALVRKLYNQMRADHLDCVRKSVEQALKVTRISIERENIYNFPQGNNTNFIDFSWMFPKQGEDLKDFQFPEFGFKREDRFNRENLDSWTKMERANLRFRMFKAFQGLGVSFPIDSFSKESIIELTDQVNSQGTACM